MHTNAYYLCRWFHPKTQVVSQFCKTSNIFLKEEVQIYVFSSTFGSQIMTQLPPSWGPPFSTSTSIMSRDQSRHPHIQWSAASHRDEHWSLLNLFCSSLSEGMELPEVFWHMSAASWISRDGGFFKTRSVCITSGMIFVQTVRSGRSFSWDLLEVYQSTIYALQKRASHSK